MTEGTVAPDRAGVQRPPLPERFFVFVGAACGRPPCRHGATLFVGRDDPGAPNHTATRTAYQISKVPFSLDAKTRLFFWKGKRNGF